MTAGHKLPSAVCVGIAFAEMQLRGHSLPFDAKISPAADHRACFALMIQHERYLLGQAYT